MRPIVMRPIILALSVLAAACRDHVSSSPTSPSIVAVAATPAQSRSATELPFRGSFTAADKAVVAPPNLLAQGTGEGNTTHLGRFTMTFSAVAVLASSTATGTFDFTASNGDHLLATFAGTAVDIEPGVVRFTEVLTIVGGTGRFAGATGTFTLRRIGIIDFATSTSTSTGSIEGHINLRN